MPVVWRFGKGKACGGKWLSMRMIFIVHYDDAAHK